MDKELPTPGPLLGTRVLDELLGPDALHALRHRRHENPAHEQMASLIIHCALNLNTRDLVFRQVAHAAADALAAMGTDAETPPQNTSGVATARIEFLAGEREQARHHLLRNAGNAQLATSPPSTARCRSGPRPPNARPTGRPGPRPHRRPWHRRPTSADAELADPGHPTLRSPLFKGPVMPTITSPRADVHTERAVAILNPRWSTWVLQTLAQAPGEHLRTGEIARALPWLSVSLVSQRIARLAQDGLVEAADHRNRLAGHRLTPAGRSLEPVHTSLTAWSREHLAHTDPLPRAEAAEQTLAALRNRHTIPILQALRDRDPVRFGEFKEVASGLENTLLGLRLHQLRDDGLVARAAGYRGRYALTDRGRALVPVIDDLTVWAHRHLAPADGPSPTAAAPIAARTSTRPTTAAPPRTPTHDAARSAATGRSTVHIAVCAVTFSHPDDTLGPGAATPTVAGPQRGGQRR